MTGAEVVDFAAATRRARRARRRTPQASLASVINRLHLYADTYGPWDERGLEVEAIGAELARLRDRPSPVVVAQVQALVDKFMPLARDSLIDLRPFVARMFAKILAAAPSTAVPELPIRLADHRSEIRQAKVDESRGPPPDKRQRRLCQEAPADAQRAKSLQTGNNDSHRICPDASALLAPPDPCVLGYPRLIERFHRLGPRPLFEFLLELGAERTISQLIEHKLRRYVERLERLDPEVLAAIGADRLPPAPIHSVFNEQGDSP